MKALLVSMLLLASAPAFADALVTLEQPTTLFQEADLKSNQVEIGAGEQLAIGDEKDGFNTAALVGSEGTVQALGFVESRAVHNHPHLWPRNPHDLHHRH